MQTVYSIMYAIRFVIIAMGCGCAFASAEKVFSSFRIENRFALGCSASVLVLPFLEYIICLLWVGIPIIILQCFPVVLSVLVMMWKKNYRAVRECLVNIKERFTSSISGKEKGRTIYYCIVGCIIIAIMIPVFQSVYRYSDKEIVGVDQSHYLTQGRIFVQSRNSWEIDNYSGEFEASVLPDDHGPLWPVYLADSLMFTENGARNSSAIYLSFVFALAAMLLALANCADILMGFHAAWISVAVALQFRYLCHFPLSGSRDGFRFAALFVFLIFMIELLNRVYRIDNGKSGISKGKRPRLADCIILAAFSYLGLNGHGGNAYIMFGICVGYSILLLLRKQFETILVSGLSIFAGMTACLAKSIRLYLNTGAFRTTTTYVYRETPVYQIVYSGNDEQVTSGRLEALLKGYTTEEKILLLFGCFMMLAILVWIVCRSLQRKKTTESDNRMIITFVLSVGMLLPLSGVMNWLAGDVQEWFFQQTRYRMYIFLTIGLLCGTFLAYLSISGKTIQIISAATAIIIGAQALAVETRYYRKIYEGSGGKWLSIIQEAADEINGYQQDGVVLTNNQLLIYYLDRPARYTSCESMRELYLAQSDEGISEILRKLNIRIIEFDWRGDDYYQYLPYYKYIQDERNADHIVLGNSDKTKCDIYILK